MLTAAVGQDQTNRRADVRLVKRLLQKNGVPLAHPTSDDMDRATIEAIRAYQSAHAILPATGVVKPRDRTVRRLWPVRYGDPAGRGVRGTDVHGSGAFGAERNGRTHDGTDYITKPGQNVYAPMSGIVDGIVPPYDRGIDSDVLSGLAIVGSDGSECIVFYIRPAKDVMGMLVRAGRTVIGVALTLQRRYEEITDHVHVRIHDPNGRPVDPTTRILPFAPDAPWHWAV